MRRLPSASRPRPWSPGLFPIRSASSRHLDKEPGKRADGMSGNAESQGGLVERIMNNMNEQ